MLSEVSSINITGLRWLLTFTVDFLLTIPEIFNIVFGMNEDSLDKILITCFNICGFMIIDGFDVVLYCDKYSESLTRLFQIQLTLTSFICQLARREFVK